MINVYEKSITIPYKGDIFLPTIVDSCERGGSTYYLAKCYEPERSFLVKKEGAYRMLLDVGNPYLVKMEYLRIKAL